MSSFVLQGGGRVVEGVFICRVGTCEADAICFCPHGLGLCGTPSAVCSCMCLSKHTLHMFHSSDSGCVSSTCTRSL